MPIDHVKLPVADLDASRAFYAAALAPFGYELVYDQEPSLGFGRGDGGEEEPSWRKPGIQLARKSRSDLSAKRTSGRGLGEPGGSPSSCGAKIPEGGRFAAAALLVHSDEPRWSEPGRRILRATWLSRPRALPR